MSQRQPGQGGQSGPPLRPPGGAGAVPDRSGPQGVAGSGDTEGSSAEGLGWEVRVPHPASRALAAAPPQGESDQPEGGGRVPGGPTAGVGATAGAEKRRPGRSLPLAARGPPARPLPSARTTTTLARSGARRGSAGPHVCALPGGGVPGRARAAVRGGRGVPRTPSLLLLPPPRPPLPLPSSCAVPSSARVGGSARRARSGQALREAGAPGGGGGGRDGGGGGGAGRETLPLCALRPGGGGQAALPSPASRP
ncbi:uncharacterized protein LOC128929603 [Callithrix jacchus]|uniref:translation initiation factor IF-2-like n=1 Tax=Callithrix jacchus TaxID=9483 RepID=UPI0023DD2A2F|nr:translation initiation factor IF-2-like [Callithrix jacchus]